MKDRRKSIALIGISGSGKTTLGRQLAEKTNRPWMDLDHIIETEQGRTISEIFKEVGEGAFRLMESKALEEALQTEGAVISCGGGIVKQEENKALLGQCTTVFLKRPLDEILESVSFADRPLLEQNPETLKTLYQERAPLYEDLADFKVDSSGSLEMALKRLERISALEMSEQKLAVIGDPIAHSLSPDIHLPVLSPFLRKVSYEKLEVTPTRLPEWLDQICKGSLDGFNVTMPHKQSILPYLDEVEEEALELDSVNTVVSEQGRLKGFNTDGNGFALALRENGVSFSDRRVAMIGAGGAGGTIAHKAAREGAREVFLYLRNPDHGRALCQTLQDRYGTPCQALSFQDLQEGTKVSEANLLVNATPLGMHGIKEEFRELDFLARLPLETLVCDFIYNPATTQFLARAKANGNPVLGGLPMLMYQAILADQHYLGAELGIKRAFRRIATMMGKEV